MVSAYSEPVLNGQIHKPQDWTRAALLCLGPGPELCPVPVRLGAGPQKENHGDSQGSQPLGRVSGAWEGSASQKTPGLSDKVCGSPFVALNIEAGSSQSREDGAPGAAGCTSQLCSQLALRPWAVLEHLVSHLRKRNLRCSLSCEGFP